MKELIEYNFPKNTFIGGWFIPTHICDDLISHFNINKHKSSPGAINIFNQSTVDLKVKDSLDLSCYFDENNITLEYTKYLQLCLEAYIQKYEQVNNIDKFSLDGGGFGLQYYKKGGGYKEWHFERGGINDSSRVLVFMTYLNDVEDGGTDFLYQNITSPARKGLTLIWPTDFTHTHRSHISNTKEKYILTGWYSLDK